MSSSTSQANTDAIESMSGPSNEFSDPEVPFTVEEMIEDARQLRNQRHAQDIAATLADLRSKRIKNCPVNTAKGYKKGKREWLVSFSNSVVRD